MRAEFHTEGAAPDCCELVWWNGARVGEAFARTIYAIVNGLQAGETLSLIAECDSYRGGVRVLVSNAGGDVVHSTHLPLRQ